MTSHQKDPLHGVTLKMMLTELQESMGWEGLSEKININCFKSNPSLKSSLTFLRRTPWAREKVERLYLKSKGVKLAKKAPKEASPFANGDSDKQKNNPWDKAARNINR
ncbi:MAG: DNA-binding protein VF530 [Alteromonadaceae bacterium]|nr:DNA-binding protein VF530 [Alteromonadaceae bacterium]